jgi:hypothetical protein
MNQPPHSSDPDATNPYTHPDLSAVQPPYHYPGEPPSALVPETGAPVEWDPYDPLVTPPGSGVGAWFERVTATVRRSWRSVGAIVALTEMLPTVAFSVGLLAYISPLLPRPGETLTAAEADARLGNLWVAAGYLILVAVLLSFVQAVGWAAATWAMVREAAGQPARLGAAFAYGFRRAPGLFGWNLIGLVLTLAGFLACILPGFYVLAGLAMAGPVFLFERRNPIGRSFKLFHDNFGPVLGRLLIIATVGFCANTLINIVQRIAVGDIVETGLTGSILAFSALGVALTLPFVAVQTIAVVVTYAEQRARAVPVVTRQLLAALD